MGEFCQAFQEDPALKESRAHNWGNLLWKGILIFYQPVFTKFQLKFIYSEKATKFCKISTVGLTGTNEFYTVGWR